MFHTLKRFIWKKKQKKQEKIFEKMGLSDEDLANDIKQNKEYLKQLREEINAREKEMEDRKQKYWKTHLNTDKIFMSSDDVPAIMGELADNAWYGKEPSTVYLKDCNNEQIAIELYGHVYEPGYEDFSATCDACVCQNGKDEETLYSCTDVNTRAYHNETVETGSHQSIIDYIDTHFTKGFTICTTL